MNERICSIEDCDKQARTRGWCSGHYSRYLRHGDPLGLSPQIADTFWDHIKVASNGCWVWQKGRMGKYTGVYVNGKRRYAHIYAWETAHGPIPKGLVVRHLCHNRMCVNVDLHLAIGTPNDNSQDSVKDFRWPHGTEHHGHKLLPAQVISLREQAHMGTLNAALAARHLGVSRDTIVDAVSGKNWRHLNQIAPPALEWVPRRRR